MYKQFKLKWLIAALLLLGAPLLPACTGAGPITPAQALRQAESDPNVARWLQAHSAPAVLGGMDQKQTKRWQQYRPAATVDLTQDGLLIRYESRWGPQPRTLEVLMDRQTGSMLPLPAR